MLTLCGEEGADVNLKQIQSELHNEVEDYLIPGKLVRVEMIPLTSNGKVQRKKLKDLVQILG